MFEVEVEIADLSALEKFTTNISTLLPRGEIIALVGEMGSGKTTFTKKLAASLGVSEASVVSPTYSIENRHDCANNETMHHFDLYRLEENNSAEFLFELVGDLQKLIVVEWPEKVLRVQQHADFFIKISVDSNEIRTLNLSSRSENIIKSIELRLT